MAYTTSLSVFVCARNYYSAISEEEAPHFEEVAPPLVIAPSEDSSSCVERYTRRQLYEFGIATFAECFNRRQRRRRRRSMVRTLRILFARRLLSPMCAAQYELCRERWNIIRSRVVHKPRKVCTCLELQAKETKCVRDVEDMSEKEVRRETFQRKHEAVRRVTKEKIRQKKSLQKEIQMLNKKIKNLKLDTAYTLHAGENDSMISRLFSRRGSRYNGKISGTVDDSPPQYQRLLSSDSDEFLVGDPRQESDPTFLDIIKSKLAEYPWLVHLITNMMGLCALLAVAKDWQQVVAALSVKIFDICTGSSGARALDLLKTILSPLWSAPVLQADDRVSSFLKCLNSGWDTFKDSTILDDFKKVIVVMLTFGFESMMGVGRIVIPDFGKYFKEGKFAGINGYDIISYTLNVITSVYERVQLVVETGVPSNFFVSYPTIRNTSLNISYCEAAFSSVIAGQFDALEENDMDEFTTRVSNLLEVIKTLVLSTKGPELVTVMIWHKRIKAMHLECVERLQNDPVRPAPFAFMVSGTSNIGKSTVLQLCIGAAARAYDIIPSPKNMWAMNPVSQYHDGYMNQDIITCSDMNKEKAEISKLNQNAAALDMVDNAALPANMAACDLKGRVFLRPKIFAATTNVPDFQAHVSMMEPGAVLRRYLHVFVTVAPHAVRAGESSIDPAHIPDNAYEATCWLYTIARVKLHAKTIGVPATVIHEVMSDDIGRLAGVCQSRALRFITLHARQHRQSQVALVRNIMTMHEHAWCPHDYPSPLNCPECTPGVHVDFSFAGVPAANNVIFHDGFNLQAGDDEINDAEGMRQSFLEMTRNYLGIIYPMTAIASIPGYRMLIQSVVESRRVRWGCGYHKQISESLFRRGFVPLALYHHIIGLVLYIVSDLLVPIDIFSHTNLFVLTFATLLFSIVAYVQLFVHSMSQTNAVKAVLLYRQVQASYVWKNRAGIVKGLAVCAGLGVMYGAWRKYKPLFQPEASLQGNAVSSPVVSTNPAFGPLQPKVFSDRLAGNKYHKLFVSPRPIDPVSATTSSKQLVDLASQKLAWFRFYNPTTGRGLNINGLPARSGWWIFPRHTFVSPTEGPRGYTHFDMRISPAEMFGPNLHQQPLDVQSVVYGPEGHDICILFIASTAGSMRDLTPHMNAADVNTAISCEFIYRDDTGCIYHDEHGTAVVANNAQFKQHGYDYRSLQYDAPFDTFPGLCGALLVSFGRNPVIMGYHTSGVTGTAKGSAYVLYKHIVMEMLERTVSDPMSIQCGNFVDVDNTLFTRSTHPKSVFHFMEDDGYAPGTVEYVGVVAHRARPRASYAPSMIAESVHQHMGLTNVFGNPSFLAGWQAPNKAMNIFSRPTTVDPRLLRRATEDYTAALLHEIGGSKRLRSLVRVLDDISTASGEAGNCFINAMEMKTSTGFPLRLKKSEFFTREDTPDDLLHPVKFHLIPLARQRVDDVLAAILHGERPSCIFSASRKVEAKTLFEADGSPKISLPRIFYGAPFELVFLMRKYLLGPASAINASTSGEMAVGMDASGDDWTAMVNQFISMEPSLTRIVALDQSHYDQSMSRIELFCFWKVILRVCKEFGYSDEEMQICNALAAMSASPLIDFFGCLIFPGAGNPSGHSLTVIINSIGNSLRMRMAFYAHPSNWDLSFRNKVKMYIYGDDSLGAVAEHCEKFDMLTIAAVLGSFGIGITDAHKRKIYKPFELLQECDFLKRGFLYDAECSVVRAPLALASIAKTLMCMEPHPLMTPDEKCASALNDASMEFFQYGREECDRRWTQLRQVSRDCGLERWLKQYPIYTYDQSLQRSLGKSHDLLEEPVDYELQSRGSTLNTPIARTAIDLDLSSLRSRVFGPKKMLLQRLRNLEEDNDIDTCVLVTAPCSLEKSNERGGGLRKLGDLLDYVLFRTAARAMCLFVACSIILLCVSYYRISETTIYKSEAEGARTLTQTVTFSDGTKQWEVVPPMVMDSTREVVSAPDATLASFFLRPIFSPEYQWIPGSVMPFTAIFDPWSLFFNNPRNINRLTNFNNLQCTLRVKAIINGNPFYYGRLMVDYQPLFTRDPTTEVSTLYKRNLVPASQRMHLFLDPCTSQGGVMALPFVYPVNALSIPNAEWSQMGRITVREVAALKHANASTVPISIIFSIWAEDVVLAVPTTLDSSSLVLQAGEYDMKPSTLATTAASWAGSLSKAPVIGRYAKATEMVLKAAAGVAKIFGFSRPNYIGPIMPMRAVPIGDITHSDTQDTSVKLTLDSRQEMTVDPGVVGLDLGDELAVSHIASRESYVTQFTWATTKISYDVLQNIRVNPVCPFVDTATYYLPACTFAALPFKYWRGTMRYRFQIIASAYHKGRLLFVYDPNFIGSIEPNVSYTKVVDLENERDFVIDVSWAQPRTWLEVGGFTAVAPFSNTAYTNVASYANGVLGVYVLNKLTSPNDTVNNDVTIAVYASLCPDDCEFSVPTSTQIYNTTYSLQADEDDNVPTKEMSDDTLCTCLPTDATDLVYFGESFPSFRAMLKRYVYHSTLTTLTSSAGSIMAIFGFPNYPNSRGVDLTNGINSTGATRANYCPTTLLTYLTPAFLTQRGNIRNKYIVCDQTATITTVVRGTTATFGAPIAVSTVGSSTDSMMKASSNWFAFMGDGAHIAATDKNQAVEVETPFYRPERFAVAKDPFGVYPTSATIGYSSHNVFSRFQLPTGGGRMAIDRYVSVGEDFQLSWFQGAPPMRLYNIP